MVRCLASTTSCCFSAAQIKPPGGLYKEILSQLNAIVCYFNGACSCCTSRYHVPHFLSWLSFTMQVILFFFYYYLEPQHLSCCYDYLAKIYKVRGQCLAQVASLADLISTLNLEAADEWDCNGAKLMAELISEFALRGHVTCKCEYQTCRQCLALHKHYPSWSVKLFNTTPSLWSSGISQNINWWYHFL